jgi:hypothetical protein
MAFVLSFSLRRLAGYLPNISVLGGGLRFLNLVPVESEIVAACQRGDILAVRNLFAEKKAAPNDMSVADRTLLFVSYTKPLRTSMYSSDALQYATQSGSTDLVRFLINAGAPIQS